MTERWPQESLPVLDPIYRGDDATLKVTASFPQDIPDQGILAGDPYPLTGKEVYFTAKRKIVQTDAEAQFQKSTLTGAIVVRDAPDDHICDVQVDGEDTADMPKSALLVCDVQVSGVKRWTVWKGYLPVYADVTRTA